MKENLRSLRQYFGLVAGLGILANAAQLPAARVSPLAFGLGITGIVLGVLFAWIAIKLPELLPARKGLVKAVVLARFAFAVLEFCLVLLLQGYQGIFMFAISVMICLYLLKSINRISAEMIASGANSGRS